MKKTKIFSIAAILSLACFYGEKASAECATVTAGIKPTGHIFYNADYGVLQVCRADGVWQAISPKECPAGDGCAGGGSTSCTSPWGGPDISHGNSVTAYETASVPFGDTCNDENRTCDDGDLSGSFTFASCNVGAPADCTLDGLTVPHGDSETFYSAEEHANCASVSQSRTCTNGTLDGSGSYQYASCEPPAGDPCETGPVGTACTSDGAIYAGTTVGGARMYAAPSDEGTYQWKTSLTSTTGTGSLTDGLANTDAMEAAGLAAHPAAQACRDRGAEWYLPARDELDVLYDNLVDQDGDNTPGGPLGSTFGFNTSGSYPAGYYWSSSEFDIFDARNQRFSAGSQGYGTKHNGEAVRCVRR